MVRLRKTKNGPRGLEAVTDPEASRHSSDVEGRPGRLIVPGSKRLDKHSPQYNQEI